MNLLLDLGHSRLKWAVDDGAALTVRASNWRDQVFAAKLEAEWRELRRPARILGAGSDKHPAREPISVLAQHCFGVRPEWLISPARLGQVSNAYADPGQLGVDRFLAMLAAWGAGLAPCIIADCGTALTLDALSADGQHLGGVILPGAGLMLQGLQEHVPVLAGIEAGEIVDCAQSTADAVHSGCTHATVGAIERFHRRMAARLGGAPALLLCGGGADSLAAQLDIPPTVIEHAVLRGMQTWIRDAIP